VQGDIRRRQPAPTNSLAFEKPCRNGLPISAQRGAGILFYRAMPTAFLGGAPSREPVFSRCALSQSLSWINFRLGFQSIDSMPDLYSAKSVMEQCEVGPADIYVVDDDIEIRQALALILSGVAYDVTCFADGSSLMEATRAKAPACILLDIGLPSP
jgi:hypothetical protein